MKAAIYHHFNTAPQVETVPDPEPPPGGVVLRVKAAGICRSDWHGWRGHDPMIRLPHVPGHEMSGEIAAVGAADEQLGAEGGLEGGHAARERRLGDAEGAGGAEHLAGAGHGEEQAGVVPVEWANE